MVAVIYDNGYTGVMEELRDIQHDFRDYINSTMHVHMTGKYCLEVIVVNGDIKYIRDLTENIQKLKGVEHAKLTTSDVKKQ